MSRLRHILALALLAGTLALPGAPGRTLCGEQIDPATEERIRQSEDMLRRAINDEGPTPEDQELARRLLRDWRLSERNGPSGDDSTEALLQMLAEGRPLPDRLVHKARDLHWENFTSEGRDEQRRRLAMGHAAGRATDGPTSGAKTSVGDWFLLIVSVLILAGGVVVSALARRRRRPDRSVYYQ